jgi:hypothetical protein
LELLRYLYEVDKINYGDEDYQFVIDGLRALSQEGRDGTHT